MWITDIQEITPGRTFRYIISEDERILAYSEVVTLWQTHLPFRRYFVNILKENPFPAYFWETPPVTEASWNQPFEFVLVNSPGLARAEPESRAFSSYFSNDIDRNGVVSFPNLGGDAVLVVPCPHTEEETYTHLANFIRKAPEIQIDAFWEKVGDAVSDMVSDRPRWLSTAGFGVFWLHVRLDTRPKYYKHHPYKTPPG